MGEQIIIKDHKCDNVNFEFKPDTEGDVTIEHIESDLGAECSIYISADDFETVCKKYLEYRKQNHG